MPETMEIKLRAWDGENMFICPSDLSQPHHVASWLEAHSVFGKNGKPSVFTQYIGLQDMDGNDIFVGDIYTYDYEYDSDYDGDMPIVKRTAGKDTVRNIFDRTQIFTAQREGKGVKIIGNIYKNPELFNQR